MKTRFLILTALCTLVQLSFIEKSNFSIHQGICDRVDYEVHRNPNQSFVIVSMCGQSLTYYSITKPPGSGQMPPPSMYTAYLGSSSSVSVSNRDSTEGGRMPPPARDKSTGINSTKALREASQPQPLHPAIQKKMDSTLANARNNVLYRDSTEGGRMPPPARDKSTGIKQSGNRQDVTFSHEAGRLVLMQGKEKPEVFELDPTQKNIKMDNQLAGRQLHATRKR